MCLQWTERLVLDQLQASYPDSRNLPDNNTQYYVTSSVFIHFIIFIF